MNFVRKAVCGVILGLVLLGTSVLAADVTFRIIDQYGNGIPGSMVVLMPSGPAVNDGESIPLDEGGYQVQVWAGMLGGEPHKLHRYESFTVTETTDTVAFVWPVATLTLNIVDQFGQPLDGSQAAMRDVTGGDPLPISWELPVTEDPALPGILGAFADGYQFTLWPGILGKSSAAGLKYNYLTLELTADGALVDFVWPTAPFAIDVVDQYDQSIPASLGGVFNSTNDYLSGDLFLPEVLTLPVTEDPALPYIVGTLVDGYDISITPGIAGTNVYTTGLNALHYFHVGYPLTSAGVDLNFTWPTATFTFDLVDQNGQSVSASLGGFTVGENNMLSGLSLPATLTLPVTEDPTLPNIAGPLTNGYQLAIWPGINGRDANHIGGYDLLRRFYDNELTTDGLNLTFEWAHMECPASLVDANEAVIPGSYVTISAIQASYTNFDVAYLPTTDESLYPMMEGSLLGGYPISLFPGGVSVGSANFEVTGALEFDPPFVNLGGNDYGLRCVPPVGSVAGSVLADCPSAGTRLYGVAVDAFEIGTGDLVGSSATDSEGNYLIEDLPTGEYMMTIVTPLGYSAVADEVAETVIGGETVLIDFSLACVDIVANPRTIGFWKHQVGVALGGKGHGHIDGATLCGYFDQIEIHFNSNEMNQVVVYEPPASGECPDKLGVAKALLNLKGNASMTSRAKQQLMALLLNVAAGNISLTEVISTDGATVSQAITFSDNLLDDTAGDHETAKTICDKINNNRLVAGGIIPLSTVNIAYKILPRGFFLAQNYPNPFNPETVIQFSLPEASYVTLDVFNVLGQMVETLVDQHYEAGHHSVRWQGSQAPSGVYFYRIEAGEFMETRKMMLLK